MLGELLGKLVPVADVVSKPRFLSPAAGGREPRLHALWLLEIAVCSANYWKSSFPLQTWFLNHGSSRLWHCVLCGNFHEILCAAVYFHRGSGCLRLQQQSQGGAVDWLQLVLLASCGCGEGGTLDPWFRIENAINQRAMVKEDPWG